MDAPPSPQNFRSRPFIPHVLSYPRPRLENLFTLSVLASDGPEGSRDTDVIKHVVRRSTDIRMGISIRYTSE